MTRVVELDQVTVHRADRKVLDISGLEIGRGERISLIGPNGAGKSTLLQVLSLLLPVSSGQISLYGTTSRAQDHRALRRRSSLVLQEPLLLKDTVFNNVALPLRFRGLPRRETHRRVFDALEAFQCDHLVQRFAHNLSGGEAQRVCLARALVCQPELLLLDEPFTALDPAARRALVISLMQFAARSEMTVLIVSHQLPDILQYTDRTVVLERGRIVQDDRPETVLRRPASLAIAQLVGMDNILPCSVEQAGADAFVRMTDTLIFPLPCSPGYGKAFCCLPGDAFRPEGDGFPASTPWVRLEAIVRQVMPGIGSCHAVVEADGLLLNVRVPREALAGSAAGDRVRLALNPQEAHLVI